jgi:hypothetical protein
MAVEAMIKYRLRQELMSKRYGSSEMLEYYASTAIKEIFNEEPKLRGYYSMSQDPEVLNLQYETNEYYIDIYYTIAGEEYKVIWCTVKKRELISSSSPRQLLE